MKSKYWNVHPTELKRTAILYFATLNDEQLKQWLINYSQSHDNQIEKQHTSGESPRTLQSVVRLAIRRTVL